MKIYLVGGAVRDSLMGLKPSDRDYVVVGSTEQEMLNEGFKKVGADFPVFLHPESGEEYALARKEYKDGNGYNGFTVSFGPEVTIEEDLYRRDLTINSIAQCLDTGEFIDPYGGREDIRLKRLTPTSAAFSDDPLRALRAARFSAKFPDFVTTRHLHDSINSLARSGELKFLKAERIWKELEKALSCPAPQNFFILLLSTGVFPELESMVRLKEGNLWHPERDVFEHIMLSLEAGANMKVDPITMFGILCHDFGKPAAYKASLGVKSTDHERLGMPIVKAFCERLRAPKDFTKMALLSCSRHTDVHTSFEASPEEIYKLLKSSSRGYVLRLLDVATCDKRGRGDPSCTWIYPQPDYLKACLSAMDSVDVKNISSSVPEGPEVGHAIEKAMIDAVQSVDVTSYDSEYNTLIKRIFKRK